MSDASPITAPQAGSGAGGNLHAEALCAAFALAVGMGFGRFAFTGMAPVMLGEGQLSMADGSLAASANYLGYLLGALAAGALKREQSALWCRIALLGTVLCTALLILPLTAWEIIAVRLVAGVFSAVALVAAAVWLFHHMRHAAGAPLLFAGVGAGILISAEIIALGKHYAIHSAWLWGWIAAGSLLCAIPAWFAMHPRKRATHAAPSSAHRHPARDLGAWRLILVYGLAGYGYIITATFLPLLMKNSLGAVDPIQVWAAFGLGAIPSCLCWNRLHLAQGANRAMAANLFLQAVGVILPVLAPNLYGYLGSALLVGGSFMGTVTIAMPAAQRVAHTVRFNLLAFLTAAYGIGQILGPVVSGVLVGQLHSFTVPLLTATLALLVAAVACLA
ncbi:MAG: hypothetical protein GAK35_03425 [Herbaspirillum frisingense]|uniref:YbfB/YjiJ family MFS transporter n=1 Tax=Herbaspirillum frisingense TaxID=92645 RepID=A0A7V8FU86_9BURK|nr:MAG: hypothetical protein GAK35_03425 [Herbaspirillum frisingense]